MHVEEAVASAPAPASLESTPVVSLVPATSPWLSITTRMVSNVTLAILAAVCSVLIRKYFDKELVLQLYWDLWPGIILLVLAFLGPRLPSLWQVCEHSGNHLRSSRRHRFSPRSQLVGVDGREDRRQNFPLAAGHGRALKERVQALPQIL